MHKAMKLVGEFHELIDARQVKLKPLSPAKAEMMNRYADSLHADSVDFLRLFKETDEIAYLRAHLIAEEFSELLDALALGNEEKTLDALGDLICVVVGTAVTYDLPLPEGFEEIAKSNLTKRPQEDDPDKARVRSKGPHYKAPDLKTVLRRHKERR